MSDRASIKLIGTTAPATCNVLIKKKSSACKIFVQIFMIHLLIKGLDILNV